MANTKDTRKANNPNGSPLLGENGLLVEKGDNLLEVRGKK